MSEMTTREQLARAMCKAEGVDPDMLCGGLGRLIPAGERWPAWKVRIKYIDAILAVLGESGTKKAPRHSP